MTTRIEAERRFVAECTERRQREQSAAVSHANRLREAMLTPPAAELATLPGASMMGDALGRP
jgi:hypothetical protein